MFRASDIFGRRPGGAPDKPAVQASDVEPAKRPAGQAVPVNRVWDPATGRFVEEPLPAEIQELMGIRKKAKLGVKEEQGAEQAWGTDPSRPRAPPKVLGPASVGLGLRGKAPVAQQRAGPGSEVDRTAPSVQYKGFSKVDLDDRYYERAAVVVNGRPTYWSGDGQFFIYWQGEVQRWAICDAASYAAVKAGQLPGWAYKEDHKHLCQASGWMEAWNGEWRTPDLEVVFRSSSHHPPQWEDPVAQTLITSVEYHGFTMKELNMRYYLRPGDVVQGRPSFWDASGVYFIYWQQSMRRWAICDLKCLEAVRNGQCPGWAYRADSAHFANACGWVETRNGEWVDAIIETSVVGESVRGLKVALSGFTKPDLNTQYVERPDEQIQGKSSLWDPSGTYFIYWQESMKRWAICDMVSLQLARSGLAPGWAYRKDSQHFSRASSWMEVWGKGWRDCTVRCKILEGVVRDSSPLVKTEAAEEASGTQLTASQYRTLVRKVYEMKNPTKLSDLDLIFEKYTDREPELFKQVCEKYGADPDEVASQMPHTAAEVGAEAEERAVIRMAKRESADAAGEDPYAHLEGAEVPELKASEFALLVQAVYERFNPKKLQDLGRILQKFKGRERDLYLEVCKKYGVHPAKYHARHQDEQDTQDHMAEPA